MQATMDVPASRTTKYRQFKVHCLRDDQATIPLLCNDWLPTPDTAWVTPAALFWSKVRVALISSPHKQRFLTSPTLPPLVCR